LREKADEEIFEKRKRERPNNNHGKRTCFFFLTIINKGCFTAVDETRRRGRIFVEGEERERERAQRERERRERERERSRGREREWWELENLQKEKSRFSFLFFFKAESVFFCMLQTAVGGAGVAHLSPSNSLAVSPPSLSLFAQASS
jgi:hypothetical protein